MSGRLINGNDVCQGATILIQFVLYRVKNFKIKPKFVFNIQNIVLFILTVGVKSFVDNPPLNLNLTQSLKRKDGELWAKNSLECM